MAIDAIEQQITLKTIDDLMAMPDDDKRYELIDGEIVEMGTSEQRHSVLGAWLIGVLFMYIKQNNLGGRLSGADGTFRFDNKNARVPDVSYVTAASAAKIPKGLTYGPSAPDFVIEIKSPSNSRPQMRRLAQRYLAAGSQLVWTIDYVDQIAHVYRPGQPVIELADEEVLDGYEVLPGFQIKLTEMFAQIEGI